MRRAGLIALAAAVLAGLWWWWLRPAASPEATAPAAAAPEARGSTRASTSARAPASGAARSAAASASVPSAAPAAPRPRTVLPRPSAPPAAVEAEAPRRIRIAERGGPLHDRRDNPGPDAPTELELVHAGLDTVREDVEACLDEWAKTDASVSGSVMIGFQLDESGLTESWVEGASELPFGVQTCFGNAVYGVDWSHVVSHPAQITNHFDIEDTRDGGPAR